MPLRPQRAARGIGADSVFARVLRGAVRSIHFIVKLQAAGGVEGELIGAVRVEYAGRAVPEAGLWPM